MSDDDDDDGMDGKYIEWAVTEINYTPQRRHTYICVLKVENSI